MCLYPLYMAITNPRRYFQPAHINPVSITNFYIHCTHTHIHTLTYIYHVYIHFVGKNGCQPRLLTDKLRSRDLIIARVIEEGGGGVVSRIIIFERTILNDGGQSCR